MQPFEAWEDPKTFVRFYFSHSDKEFTTGVMLIPSGIELPKHNRPLAVENLVQIVGQCLIKTFDENDFVTTHVLKAGDSLSMPRGQFHIHSNPNKNTSVTLFKAVGDITAVVASLRESFKYIELKKS